jgi:hypothetical protein
MGTPGHTYRRVGYVSLFMGYPLVPSNALAFEMAMDFFVICMDII